MVKIVCLLLCQALLSTLYTWPYFLLIANIIKEYFYHFCFTAMGAKAQRGMILITESWHISGNPQMDAD